MPYITYVTSFTAVALFQLLWIRMSHCNVSRRLHHFLYRTFFWLTFLVLRLYNAPAEPDRAKSCLLVPRAPSKYPKWRLIARSREVSKPRDLYLELPGRFEIWQALRQHCCRCTCKISKGYDNLKYQSRGFETSRDLTIRRLFGYWDGALPARFLVSPGHQRTHH